VLKRLIITIVILISTVKSGTCNDFYVHGSFPAPGSPATSAGMRAELDLISAGFDKLPALSGNAGKLVVVGAGGSSLTTTSGTISLSGALTINGAYDLTLNLTGATSLTLPTSGTVATTSGAEDINNKTFQLGDNTLTGTIAQFNTALTDGDFATIAGTETLTNKTLTAPALNAAVIGSGSSVGTSNNALYQLGIGGTFAPSSSATGAALSVRTTITGQVNQEQTGVLIFPTINEAGSGTHAWLSSMEIDPPTIGAGAAAVTQAATLRVTGFPTASGANIYAIHVDAGDVKLANGALQIEDPTTNNPNIHFDDGPNDHYFEISSGDFRFFTPGSMHFSPGSGDKVTLTDTGMIKVGTAADITGLSAGSIALNYALGFGEISDPGTPSANHATLYARDNGAGKTQLVVMFSDGVPQVVCTQP